MNQITPKFNCCHRAFYLLVTEAPHNIESLRMDREETLVTESSGRTPEHQRDKR